MNDELANRTEDPRPKYKTDYWPKPIPINRFDWSATLPSYEGGDPIGYGPTEAEAIADLEEQLSE